MKRLVLAFMCCACAHPAPASPAPPITRPTGPVPVAARQAIDQLAAACAKNDLEAVRALLEPTIVTEPGADPVSADATLAVWRDDHRLAEIAAAIAGGCEPSPADPQTVMCPRAQAVEAQADAGVLVVVLRPTTAGAWLVFQAVYAD